MPTCRPVDRACCGGAAPAPPRWTPWWPTPAPRRCSGTASTNPPPSHAMRR